jgi:hypothetical protein
MPRLFPALLTSGVRPDTMGNQVLFQIIESMNYLSLFWSFQHLYSFNGKGNQRWFKGELMAFSMVKVPLLQIG